MTEYNNNPFIKSDILPVDIVFHPSWWYKHAGITFDEDFFHHPLKRVEEEQHMEKELYERFGHYGLGSNINKLLPVIGGDKTYNLSVIERLSREASKEGSEIISFHECSITGYTFARHLSKEQMLDMAESVPDGESTLKLIALSKKFEIVILAGLFEKLVWIMTS
ncbi:MAG: hypothetical protein MUC93_07730 [Bacteroidales bacterium]|jgi:hypothetical protein|nr:hypothetical protein [Bacteroidales bacterium]